MTKYHLKNLKQIYALFSVAFITLRLIHYKDLIIVSLNINVINMLVSIKARKRGLWVQLRDLICRSIERACE